MSGYIFNCCDLEVVLLVSIWYRSGMLLSVLQCTGQLPSPHPSPKRIILLKIKIVLRLRNPGLHDKDALSENDSLYRTQNRKLKGILVIVTNKDSYVRACPIAQLCSTLCDTMDSSPPGSSVHGILQARILWVAVSSSRRSSLTRGSKPHLLHCQEILYHWPTRAWGLQSK